MREFYLDYDDVNELDVVRDVQRICRVIETFQCHAKVEHYLSSSTEYGAGWSADKNSYHVKIIFPSDKSFNFCLGLLLISGCDEGYKNLVLERREFTIRVSEEVSTDGVKPKPRHVNTWYV